MDGVASIGDFAFYNCPALTSILLPDSVVSVGNSSFSGCGGLSSLALGPVTSIGDNAFERCNHLVSVTFGGNSKFTSIGINAFYNCSSLTSISIPDSVKNIKQHAFLYCSGLTCISFGTGLTNIGTDAFASHIFYDVDGRTLLKPTADNLRGYVFIAMPPDKMVRQSGTDGNIEWSISGDTLIIGRDSR